MGTTTALTVRQAAAELVALEDAHEALRQEACTLSERLSEIHSGDFKRMDAIDRARRDLIEAAKREA